MNAPSHPDAGPLFIPAVRASLPSITQQIATRRAHFEKYVMLVVVFCTAICGVAILRLAISAIFGDHGDPPRATAVTEIGRAAPALHAAEALRPLAASAPAKVRLGARPRH